MKKSLENYMKKNITFSCFPDNNEIELHSTLYMKYFDVILGYLEIYIYENNVRIISAKHSDYSQTILLEKINPYIPKYYNYLTDEIKIETLSKLFSYIINDTYKNLRIWLLILNNQEFFLFEKSLEFFLKLLHSYLTPTKMPNGETLPINIIKDKLNSSKIKLYNLENKEKFYKQFKNKPINKSKIIVFYINILLENNIDPVIKKPLLEIFNLVNKKSTHE